MKKLFAIVLAVVMVLSVASMAMAGLWDPAPADPSKDFGYEIDVERYALQTGVFAFNYVTSGATTAANGADVYYMIKLTVPDKKATEPVRANAWAKVTFDGIAGQNFNNSISGLEPGTYYYNGSGTWTPAATIYASYGTGTLSAVMTPVVQARCFDTTKAKITAEVSSDRDLGQLNGLVWKGYTLKYVAATAGNAAELTFTKDGNSITFDINSSTKQASKKDDGVSGSGTFESNLFAALGFTAKDLNDGNVYFSDKNLRAVFGFSYSAEDSVGWTANSTPVILDPTITIPKTGDNASVIGFAMIMVAVVAAAVAVKKVKA